MNKRDWLEKKYFHIGNTIASAKGMLNIFKKYFAEFDCLMVTREFYRYNPRGEQVSRILKEFANMGFLIQKNTLEGTDINGRKKARYVYKLKQGVK